MESRNFKKVKSEGKELYWYIKTDNHLVSGETPVGCVTETSLGEFVFSDSEEELISEAPAELKELIRPQLKTGRKKLQEDKLKEQTEADNLPVDDPTVDDPKDDKPPKKDKRVDEPIESP